MASNHFALKYGKTGYAKMHAEYIIREGRYALSKKAWSTRKAATYQNGLKMIRYIFGTPLINMSASTAGPTMNLKSLSPMNYPMNRV